MDQASWRQVIDERRTEFVPKGRGLAAQKAARYLREKSLSQPETSSKTRGRRVFGQTDSECSKASLARAVTAAPAGYFSAVAALKRRGQTPPGEPGGAVQGACRKPW